VADVSGVALPGPLAQYAEGFAAELSGRGYAGRSVGDHCRLLAEVSRWLGVRELDAGALSEGLAEEFLAECRAAGRRLRARAGSLEPLLAYLRELGLVRVPDIAPAGEIDAVLARFSWYLAAERGLAEKTISLRAKLVRPFLAGLTGSGGLDLRSLTAEEVTAFIVAESRLRPASVPPTVTALRSLLRFLHVDGVIAAGLAGAVPTARSRRLAGLPKTLTSGQVAAMLAACDLGTAVGRRNLAILTLLSRLGLRAGEVAALRLDDIDWRRGEISIAGKGARHDRLPLPREAGTAIVAYLQDGRPRAGMREVFLCARAPYRPMHPATVSNVAESAARKAGLGVVHAHRLRHSAATAMLRGGGSLEEISQVLRHRHAATTAIYAKVDLDGLRGIARPWPGTAA
jgi:integrase/recombinase XerD